MAEVDYKALKNGGFMRQKQKNYFSLRLKVVGGNLMAEQLVAIAGVSRKYGGGHVHLTSRQGVEIPFIRLRDIDAVKASLEEGGVSAGVSGPRVRTVTACQGSAVCPGGCIDTHSLAVAISERYFGRDLPHKFKFGVTGCQNNCLKAEENDLGVKGGYSIKWKKEACTLCGICVKACRTKALSISENRVILKEENCSHCGRCVKSCPANAWKGKPGYILSFGGTFGNTIAKGVTLLPIVGDRKTLFRLADAALNFFVEHAESGERFRPAVERVGWDALKAALEGAWRKK